MKRLFTLTIQFAVVAIIVQACSGKAEPVAQQTLTDTVPVTVLEISKVKIQPVIQASGQLTTDDETYLAFKTGGIIRSLKIREGDAIRKGQVLATLDLTVLELFQCGDTVFVQPGNAIEITL